MSESTNLAPKEKRLLRRAALLPHLVTRLVIVAVLIAVPWLICITIRGAFFNDSQLGVSFYVYLGIVIAYMLAFCVCAPWVVFTMGSDAWKRTSRRAANRAGDPKLVEDPTKLADVLNIGMSAKRVKTISRAIAIVPFVLMLAVSVPEVVTAVKAQTAAQRSQQQLASATCTKLADHFKQAGYEVRADDPMDSYSASLGYNIWASDPNNDANYLCIGVDNDGKVDDVTYYYAVEKNLPMAENLDQAGTFFSALNATLKSADVEVEAPELLSVTGPGGNFGRAAIAAGVGGDADDTWETGAVTVREYYNGEDSDWARITFHAWSS